MRTRLARTLALALTVAVAVGVAVAIAVAVAVAVAVALTEAGGGVRRDCARAVIPTRHKAPAQHIPGRLASPLLERTHLVRRTPTARPFFGRLLRRLALRVGLARLPRRGHHRSIGRAQGRRECAGQRQSDRRGRAHEYHRLHLQPPRGSRRSPPPDRPAHAERRGTWQRDNRGWQWSRRWRR